MSFPWGREDYLVEGTSYGSTARELIDETVDIVILDREWFDNSDMEVLAYIREMGYDCQVVIVSAAHPDPEVIRQGVDDYLIKPLTEDELQETVERLLTHAEPESAGQGSHSLS